MKLNRKKIIVELDKYFSLIVRKIGKCFICGSTENLTCGHLITRVNYSTRWDFENAECLCLKCNYKHEFHPEIFIELYIEKYGFEKYKNIIAKSKQIKKFQNFELIELLEKFKKYIRAYK